MQSEKIKKPIGLYVLILLLIFLSVSALYGSSQLILDPSGNLLQLPLEYLHTSLFIDYLIPGIILFSVLGVLPLFTVYFLLTKAEIKMFEKINPFKQFHWSWTLSGVVGVGVGIWIGVEVLLTRPYPFLQLPFIILSLLIITLTLLPNTRKYYKK